MPLPLWKHQAEGIKRIQDHAGYLLAFDMGTGKSRCVVQYIKLHRPKRTLIVCPKSVISVWVSEFDKFLGGGAENSFVVVPLGTGNSARSLATLRLSLGVAAAREDLGVVVIVNYESAWRGQMTSRSAYTAGLGELIKNTQWDLVVADEAHKIKSPGGRASRFMSQVGAKCPKRVALTGTPMPHSPLDIYGLYRFLDPSVFGFSFVRFRARYAVMGGYQGKQVIGYQQRVELRSRVNSIAMRVRKEEVLLDLPKAIHLVRSFDLGSTAAKMYRQLDKEFVADVGAGVITAANALVRLLRLQQLTSGFYVADEDGRKTATRICEGKPNLLAEVLEGIGKNEPVVVFCRFRADLDAVRATAGKAERDHYELSGRTNQLADWQEDSTGSVLGVQIQSGGVGVSMVRSCYCVFYSLGFSMGDYQQALARVHRQGQKRPVTHIHLIATGTVDRKVYTSMEKKEDAVRAILSEIQEVPA